MEPCQLPVANRRPWLFPNFDYNLQQARVTLFLPEALTDLGLARQATVKLFCPKCEDIYFPRSKYQVQKP